MKVLNKEDIISRLDGIDELPMLPDTVMKVNTMLQEVDFCIKDLSRIIEKDQSMVSKLLKIVNSTFFGLSSRISSVNHAIVILGLNTVRNALLSGSVIESMSSLENIKGIDIRDFWTHSISVAVMSNYLAEKTKLCFPDDCFTAGLLHDMGKLIISSYFVDEFGHICKFIKDENLSFFDAEKKVIEGGHDFIGAYLAKRWNLPPDLISTIRLHHQPLNNLQENEMALLIQIADYMVNNMDKEKAPEPGFLLVHSRISERIWKEIRNFPEWVSKVKEDIDSACKILLG
jgi:putative nucleotidyltransferase with HDIG domain